MRKITYTVGVDEISPSTVQFAGFAGENYATKLVFDIKDELRDKIPSEQGVSIMLECIDNSGEYDVFVLTRDVVDAPESVTFDIPKEITELGGRVTMQLSFVELDADFKLKSKLFAYPIKLRFAPSTSGGIENTVEYERYHTGVLSAMVRAEQAEAKAEEQAQSSSDAASTAEGFAKSAEQSANYAAKSAIDVAKNTERVAELKDEIGLLVGNIGVPEYWEEALENGAQAINERLCEAGSDKSAFLFYSDIHWTDGSNMSPTLLKYLYKHTGMTKTFFGGDVIGYGRKGEGTDYDTMSYLWDWRNQVKDLPNHHSVVGNHDDGQETNNLFSEAYVYGYLRAAEETPDIVRGSEGLYYYIDNIPENTRYLFLDTAYRGATASQLDFIKQALLTTPNDWHIVAISHIWYDADYSVSPPVISDLNSNASQILDLFDNYNSRNDEYAECKGKVEFCVGGHTHRDYDGTFKGIPIILVETDSSKVRSGLNYELGTTTEASVNGIIADYDKHKIYVVRIGRGDSREIPITNYTTTNVLPLAVDVGGTPYNNGQGWKADTKYSASKNEDQNATGIYVTGYIPVKPNDVVYLKNITMPNNDASKDAGKLFFFTALGGEERAYSGQAVTSWGESTKRAENENLIQFTVPSTPAFSYVRIQGGVTNEQTAPAMSKDSIITINEPIEKTEV